MASQEAQEYAEDLVGVFWPHPDQETTTVSRGQIIALIRTAFYGGQDSVIHKTVDDLRAIRHARD